MDLSLGFISYKVGVVIISWSFHLSVLSNCLFFSFLSLLSLQSVYEDEIVYFS